MGDWNFLGGILEEVHIHSTMVGKIWLTILFVFRMLVLGVAAEDVWNDEQADFVCNTEQPGCRNVCYDLAFPISLIRYWVLQVIFVSSPSLVYMGHALYRLRALEKERQRKKALLRKELELVDAECAEARRRIEREMKQLDQRKINKAPLRGSLLCTYAAHIGARSLVEVAFITGQYVLYGVHLCPLFRCEREPCPNAVDCYVSRPTEKSVFMVFMQCIAALSLFLGVLEIAHLGYKHVKRSILDSYPHARDDGDELDNFMNRMKKESVVQVCASGARKTTTASAPGEYSILMDKVQGTVMYPNLAKPLLGQPATQHNMANITGTSTAKPCLPGSDAPSNAKQEADDASDRDKEGSPAVPKHQPRAPHAFPGSAQPASASKRRWKTRGSPRCSTVPEGTSSDALSRAPAKPSGGSAREQKQPKPDGKDQSCSSSLDTVDESSSASGRNHTPSPPPPTCRTSA
ncbi:gap junction protein alpha 9a [Betta splendens]|uniref:Gap junction protein n=1 Tax=Betta splendens TaxID=158456 RepID=A0A6P7KSE4_BETSP|nr:gap junction protein alpha 9a [Betta splendens]